MQRPNSPRSFSDPQGREIQYSPFATGLAASLRVDHIQSGQTGEILEVLVPEIHVSRKPGGARGGEMPEEGFPRKIGQTRRSRERYGRRRNHEEGQERRGCYVPHRQGPRSREHACTRGGSIIHATDKTRATAMGTDGRVEQEATSGRAAIQTKGRRGTRISGGGRRQTCQLVSGGRPEICIRCDVRRGRGGARSPKAPSRARFPRANWTVMRSPMKSDPSSVSRAG
jgi:hypothetical protein